MKVIFLREGGGSRTIGHDTLMWTAGTVAVVLLVAALFVTARSFSVQEPEIVSQWRAKLAAQQSAVQELQLVSQSQADTLGRQLALLQARIMRMEALGERIVDVAELDAEEFSFAQAAATGGPLQAQPNGAVDGFNFVQPEIDTLTQSLMTLERELKVMETLLRDNEYRQAKAPAGRPITWGWLSSPYGQRIDPISGKKAWHAGVDFAGRRGSDVVSVAGGVVTYAGTRYGYGQMVEITHGDGYATRYAHHDKILVELGDVVKPGQVIALMGSSGRSTGPHVHFEVLKNGRHVNPSKYVAGKR